MLGISSHKHQYKYPYFFLALYLVFLLSTVCLASRITQLSSILVPGGIFVFPFTFCICDIVGEVYGYAYPRLFIWIGVFVEIVFSMIVIVVSHLPVPAFFNDAQAYQVVFDPTIRYIGAGLMGLLVGELANVYLLAKWKVFLRGRFFILRSLAATAFGQALLTIIVDALNYFGKMAGTHLGWMMLCGYLWKMSFALLMAFPAWLIVKYLKKMEHVDHYDIHTNFSPFSLALSERQDSNTAFVNTESVPQ